MTKDDVIQRLRELQRKGKFSQKSLAEALGITPTYLCDIYKGRRDPGQKVLSALGLDVEKVYGIKK